MLQDHNQTGKLTKETESSSEDDTHKLENSKQFITSDKQCLDLRKRVNKSPSTSMQQTSTSLQSSYSQKQHVMEDLFKLVLIGASNSGKTSLFRRFISNVFDETYQCTIGFDFKVKSL